MIVVPIVCSDKAVQRFIAQMMMLSPYSVPSFQMTAGGLIDAAVARFGDRRCHDLAFWLH
jgi:hypothetical protein